MDEYHVCGILLMTRPELAPRLALELQGLDGVELHAQEGGRLVVTIEGLSYAHCAERLNHLASLPGVAASSLVYHQVDNDTGAGPAAASGSGRANNNDSPSQETAP